MFRAVFLAVAVGLLVSTAAEAQPLQAGIGQPAPSLQAISVKPTSWTETTSLPAEGGQVLATYSIANFVEQAGVGSEKLVLDWVLQDTGYATWHGSQLAALAADPTTLTCFHVPEIQDRVADVVTRFVGDAAAPHRFLVRVVGVGSPSWRGDVAAAMQPLPTTTPGVQAWMMPRESAALLLATLRGRSDYREVPTGPVLAANGQPAVISGGRRRPYVRDVAAGMPTAPGWQTVTSECDEGLSVEVQPLMTADGAAVEAVFRCRLDQIERMATVAVDVPAAGQGQFKIEVPQSVAVRVGERFRWPATQTLVVGLGLVPWPVPDPAGPGGPTLLPPAALRMDVLVVVEPRLAAAAPAVAGS
jgi:hypothetical protein